MVIEKEATAAIPPETSQAQSGGVLRVIDACADGLLVMALMGELGIVFANVLARVFFNTSFLWADEVARFVLSIIAFIGGAVACRRRGHAFVRVLLNRCPAGMQRVFFALADVLALFITLVAWVASFEFIESSWSERTPIFQIPAATQRQFQPCLPRQRQTHNVCEVEALPLISVWPPPERAVGEHAGHIHGNQLNCHRKPPRGAASSGWAALFPAHRSEEHTSELQSLRHLV